jgi:hypothetical protein
MDFQGLPPRQDSQRTQKETERLKMIDVNDSYSFTYSLSRNEIKSRSDISLTTPRNLKHRPRKSKNPSRIVNESSQKGYQPKYLTRKKYPQHKDKHIGTPTKVSRKTWTAGNKKRDTSITKAGVPKEFLIRKSAYSKMFQKNHEKLALTQRKLKKKSERNLEVMRDLMDNSLFGEKEDRFVEKSMNRLSHLEDIRDVIVKSKKAVSKSKSRPFL